MNLFRKLWQDEAGYVLSAEAALLGTVGVVGATVGLGAVSKAVNDELTEVAYAFRSLDQSYCIEGQTGCGACTAPSCYTQPDVEQARADLGEWIDEQQAGADEERPSAGDAKPAQDAKPDEAAPSTTPRQTDARRREFEERRRLHEEQMKQREQMHKPDETPKAPEAPAKKKKKSSKKKSG